mmetsp:Transcript_57350/g.166503  ORF Transcript_57350/g.166503 Transcript_57350/m.166503 type:complete len:404 (-) Transcript_57350:60-1271(-)
MRDIFEASHPGSIRPPLVPGVAVPMPAHAVHKLCGDRVAVDRVGAQEEVVAIVVPSDKLKIHSAALERGPEMIADEVALLIMVVQAVLPRKLRLRLVLHAEAPKRQALPFQGLCELDIELGPSCGPLGLQLAAVAHLRLVLHPCRRAPRAGEKLDCLAGGLVRAPDQRENRLLVPLDGETLQLGVALLFTAAPVPVGEVARVHVQPADVEAQAGLPAEVGLHDALLICGAHLCEDFRGGLGEGRAKAVVGLEPHCRIDDEGRLALARPPFLQLQGRHRGHALAGASGGAHDGHFAGRGLRRRWQGRRGAGVEGQADLAVQPTGEPRLALAQLLAVAHLDQPPPLDIDIRPVAGAQNAEDDAHQAPPVQERGHRGEGENTYREEHPTENLVRRQCGRDTARGPK